MQDSLRILTITAASIAFIHTIFGPDHYLPFIVMARARGWSRARTVWITLACGLGHVLSSVVLGFIGIAFGFALMKLEAFEYLRGNLAAWALMVFGFAYMIWGIRRAIRNRPHKHRHVHANGTVHEHEHTHGHKHAHVHGNSLTPWILFLIFVLGPCEPLIPLLMYPAAQQSTWGVVQVSVVFGIVTMATMLGVVLLADAGIRLIDFGKLERYTHAFGGGAIFLSGFAVVFLGL